jgi:hypothetical protein
MPVAKESRKSIKIGERIRRPLKLHRSSHDLNAAIPTYGATVRHYRVKCSARPLRSPPTVDSVRQRHPWIAPPARRQAPSSRQRDRELIAPLCRSRFEDDSGPFVDFDEAFGSVHQGRVTPAWPNIKKTRRRPSFGGRAEIWEAHGLSLLRAVKFSTVQSMTNINPHSRTHRPRMQSLEVVLSLQMEPAVCRARDSR